MSLCSYLSCCCKRAYIFLSLSGLSICGHNCLLTAEWMSASKIVCHVGPAKDDKGEIIVSTKSGGHGTSTVSFKLLKAEKIGKMAALCNHSSSNTSLSVNHQRNSRTTTPWRKYRQSSSVLPSRCSGELQYGYLYCFVLCSCTNCIVALSGTIIVCVIWAVPQ